MFVTAIKVKGVVFGCAAVVWSLASVLVMSRDVTISQHRPMDCGFVLQLLQTNMAYDACTTPGGQAGHCRHLRFCMLDVYTGSYLQFLPYFCRITRSVGTGDGVGHGGERRGRRDGRSSLCIALRCHC
jgi:hypothetical protein